MSSRAKGFPSKRELIDDLKRLGQKYPNATINRDFYRHHGKFNKDSQWSKYFSDFTQFREEAGLGQSKSKSRPKQSKPKKPETSEVVGDKWTIHLPSTRIHTLEQLLEYAEVDESVWKVKSFLVNKWEVGAADKVDGELKGIIVEPLFQVKATLERKSEIIAIRKEIERLKQEAREAAPYPRPVVRSIHRSGNLLEVNIPDSHFGKLAWGVETGYENYDTKIAEQTFLRALETLLDRVKGYSFDQVVFVVGNDLFNSDNIEDQTTRGTKVTTDGRYYKTFGIVRRTITQCIERLREVAPVKVIMVSGNHDQQSVWHLGDSLECYFHKYTDVEIENTPILRKYHQHGKVMLMFTHGDKGKRQDYPLLMATEKPEMFGSTRFRECHTGHTHMTKMDEQHGVRVRVLPALCPPDDWHAENGFVGNLRSAEAYVWNLDEGLVNLAFYNDDAHPQIITKTKVKIAA